jgi:3-oxosteroid 1-dehydrogenase
MTNYQGHRDLNKRPVVVADDTQGAPAETDVIVVGSGAAGHVAAIMAARNGCEVVILEAAATVGGTSFRSSGGFWIPNNRAQRERGVTMERDRTLKHMALLSYPELFDADDVRLGLTPAQFDLLALYFDIAPRVIDELADEEILGSIQLAYPNRDDGMPAYYETEFDDTAGTVLATRVLDGHVSETGSNPTADALRKLGGRMGDGADMIRALAQAAERYGVQVHTRHRVHGLVQDETGDVTGVTVQAPNGSVVVSARRGVVFATGGFSHDADLAKRYLRGPIVGSCSVDTARGDFIPIALAAGAELGNMEEAWWTELAVEMVKDMPSQPDLISFISGASSFLVNVHGVRVVNEKLMYNDRGKVHFQRDDSGGLTNQLLFLIYDDDVAQDPIEWPARYPIPAPGANPPYVIKASTIEELTTAIAGRLADLAKGVDGITLASDFARGLAGTIERYNGFALAGVDEDFGRGNRSNQRYDPPARPGMKNNTMAPFAADGPYYAMILGAATLDTKGGPMIDTHARVLRPGGEPIPGLYGAGNCIASPAAEAYWGGGSTLGPAIVFGYVAGSEVAKNPARAFPAPAA